MGFCEFHAVKLSQSREIHRCTRKRQGCTRNRHTSGRGSPPDRSIRLCACCPLRTADWYNERLNLCGGERQCLKIIIGIANVKGTLRSIYPWKHFRLHKPQDAICYQCSLSFLWPSHSDFGIHSSRTASWELTRCWRVCCARRYQRRRECQPLRQWIPTALERPTWHYNWQTSKERTQRR